MSIFILFYNFCTTKLGWKNTIFQIEREKLHILLFLGVFVVIFMVSDQKSCLWNRNSKLLFSLFGCMQSACEFHHQVQHRGVAWNADSLLCPNFKVTKVHKQLQIFWSVLCFMYQFWTNANKFVKCLNYICVNCFILM